MNLYALRDRLLDYFMQPFIGPGDKQVLAALSSQISKETDSVIAQAPSDFEIWRLAEIDEQTGQVGGEREYLAGLASLVRGGVRDRALATAAAIPNAPGKGGGSATEAPGGTDTDQRPAPDQAQAADRPRAENNQVLKRTD